MAVEVKVCGLTNREDAVAALRAGAGLLGFIFFRKSPRYIEPTCAGKIVGALRRLGRPFLAVGVFVNAPAEEVADCLDAYGLDLAQLHGEEPVEHLSAAGLAGRAYKAIRPANQPQAEEQARRYALPQPDASPALLVDSHHPTLHGGTGAPADWSLAATLAAGRRLLLAGGLTPENVADAIRQVRPWGVDVSSGVEAAPGRKDPARLAAFLAAVQAQGVEE